jgi:membrane-associated phospholipid phosphatase
VIGKDRERGSVVLTFSSELWRTRLVLAVLLTLWITIPYYGLQRLELFAVHQMSPSSFDRAVPFAQSMAWPYLSMFVLLILAPCGLSSPCAIRRFVMDFFLLGLVSSVIFLFWPTSAPRPVIDEVHDPLYAVILATDSPRNACPSLHASMTVYSALWCLLLLRGHSRRRAILGWGCVLAWTLVILYATIATRQHVLVDLLAGAALAGLIFFRPGPPRR